MDRDLHRARRKELQRRGQLPGEDFGHPDIPGGSPVHQYPGGQIHPDTIVTRDSNRMLITEATMKHVANIVSNKYLKRKMRAHEIKALDKFVRSISPELYQGKTYRKATHLLAHNFHLVLTNPAALNIGLARRTEIGKLHEYQKAELADFTNDEHPHKYNTFYDEVGETDHNHRIREVLDFPGYNPPPPPLTGGIRGSTRPKTRPQSGPQIQKDALEYPPGPENFTNGHGADTRRDAAALASYAESSHALKEINKLLHSYLTGSRSIKDIFARGNMVRITSDDIGLRDHFIPLDSRRRDTQIDNADGTRTLTKFNVHNAFVRGSEGSIRVQSELKEILEITIGEFWIPSEETETGFFGNEFYEKIRVAVEEINGQSAITAEDNFFHFEFTFTKTGTRLFLKPNPPYDKFIFRYPVARLESITLRFLNPVDTITFFKDRAKYTLTAVGAPARFTINSGTHDLAVDDIIYIENWTSTSDAETILATRAQGHRVTAVTGTTFDINQAFPTGETSNAICVVYGSKRMFIPLHLKTLE